LRLLVLGRSNLLQRRVLPALQQIDGLEAIDIASRRAPHGREPQDRLEAETFSDYETALDRSRADVVYVSLVNSEHRPWAARALESGRHVVVDKPAFLWSYEAEQLLDLAEKRNCCLAEATVWAYHPQVAAMKSVFAEAGSFPTRISAAFSVPPLDPGNFRYCRSLGGGSVWDQGPYAVSIGRVFFDAVPETLDCQVLSSGGADGVDTAFSMLATYPNGGAVAGHFGFDTAYRNHLEVFGPNTVVDADRIFTIPAEAENEIRVTAADKTTVRTAPPANPFRVFFERVFAAIATHDWRTFSDDLLADARALQRLRDAAGLV
jgi:predicted dehydrogenase